MTVPSDVPGWYRLDERIRWGRHNVGRGIDTRTGAPVVLKQALGPAQAELLRREIRVLERLGPLRGLPTLIASEPRGPQPWMVLGDAGRCLEEVWGGPREVRDVLDLGVAVARVLAAAHTAGVVHADIKPANIVVREALSGSGRFVVIDFDVAVDIGSADSRTNTRVRGTDRYMAPEVRRDGRTSRASDVFAVGVVLAEALVGVGERFEWSVPALLDKAPQLDRGNRIHLRLAQWIIAAGRLSQVDRPSAERLGRALSTLSTGRLAPSPYARPWMRPVLFGTGVLLLVAIVGVGASIQPPQPTPEDPPPPAPSIATETPSVAATEPVPTPTAVRPPQVPTAQTQTVVQVRPTSPTPDPTQTAQPIAAQPGGHVQVRITGDNADFVTVTLQSPDGPEPLSGSGGLRVADVTGGQWTVSADFSGVPGAGERLGDRSVSRVLVEVVPGIETRVVCGTAFFLCRLE